MAISDGVRDAQPGDDGPAGSRREDAPLLVGDADAVKEAAGRRAGLRGWRDGVRATPSGRLALKIVVGVIGALLVIGGLVMVPFPGPGWLVVFAGLALLATEFHWAHRVLEFAKKTLAGWTDWLKEQGWTVRILVVAVTFAVAGAIIWFVFRQTTGIDLAVEGWKLLGR